jgi:hypothetical protein
MFFNQIDEGLWFYLRDIELAPVPGSHPRYNTAYDLAENYRTERLPSETFSDLEAKRLARDKQLLIEWLDRNDHRTSYVLIRSQVYDRYAHDLASCSTPVIRETGLKRNELTLLRVGGERPTAARTATATPTRR